MADYPLLAVLATGNPGEVNTSNFGKIPKLKVTDALDVTNNITVGGTVDGVDIATLKTDFDTLDTNFGTHDGGSAKDQHDGGAGTHAHTATAAEGSQLSHATAFSAYGTGDHTEHPLLDGSRAFTGTQSGVTPTTDAHLATKGYTDGLVEGLPNKYACRARAQGNINLSAPGASIDGVTMAVDDRFLADQQSTGSQDGIYLWKGAAVAAVRADDFPAGFNARGSYCFIEEGTDADNGFVCTNDKGSDVVGTDPLTFIQYSGAGQITAGTGLTKAVNTINAIGGDGIVANADDLAVDLDGTAPGLEFSSAKLQVKIEASKGLTVTSSGLATVPNTAAGLEVGASGLGINLQASNPSLEVVSTELAVKIYANGGLQRDANGVSVKLNDTPDTLDVDSSGIKVVGLPSLFKINGTAVGSTVTAVNLDELTDGSSSVTLHTHDLASHAIGGASHSTSTKANVNSKISDLIATYGAFRDIGVGTAAQRPSAGTAGRFWWATDTDAYSYDNGATWDDIVAVAAAHDFEGASHNACTLAELNAANTISDADLIASADTRLPIQGENDALIGTSGTPSTTNKYVTNDDSRNTNARAPTAHDLDSHNSCTLAELSTDISDDSVQGTSEKGAASGYASLNGSTKVVEDPANATATPTASKIPIADGSNKLAAGWISEVLAYSDLTDDPVGTHAALDTGVHGAGGDTLATDQDIADHAGAADPHTGYQKESEKGAASGYASLNGSTLVVQNPANATATPAADKIVMAEGDGKINGTWIDPSDITGADLSWEGKQNFNDEITVSTLLMDGDVIGPQVSATIGTGGTTAGDACKLDGTGQLVRRSADSDPCCGICTVGGAATATGWYCPMGIVEVTYESGFAPSSYGEAVFLSQTGGEKAHWSTAVPQGAGKIYEGWAYGTGVSAKIFFTATKQREIEA